MRGRTVPCFSSPQDTLRMSDSSPVYVDFNATTPLAEEVRAAIVDSLDCWGNPSSANARGAAAKRVVEKARRKVAGVFDVPTECVVFTSGGSEVSGQLIRERLPQANNLVATSFLSHHKSRSDSAHKLTVISSVIEHCSVLNKLEELKALGEIGA